MCVTDIPTPLTVKMLPVINQQALSLEKHITWVLLIAYGTLFCIVHVCCLWVPTNVCLGGKSDGSRTPEMKFRDPRPRLAQELSEF